MLLIGLIEFAEPGTGNGATCMAPPPEVAGAAGAALRSKLVLCD
jgi:hypothetical protein